MKRRDLIKGMALVLPLLMTGCATEALLSSGRYSKYSEQIEAVLISHDLQNIAVIGSTYDYVFQDAKRLSRIIQSSIHKHLSGEFSTFNIRDRNEVHGALTLILDSTDTKIVEEARALGFHTRATGELYFPTSMKGLRYRKNPGVVVGETYKLNTRYTVDVSVPVGVNPGKLLLTPVALAADGVLVLLGLPLVALFVVFRPKLL